MRSRFAFLWVLATTVIAGIAAYFAYGAGIATHITASAVNDGAVYYHPFYPFFPFFGFGLLLPILFIGLVFLALRRRRWGRGGWGGYGMHGGFPQGVPPQVEERLRHWHQAAHSESSAGTAPDAPEAPATGTAKGG